MGYTKSDTKSICALELVGAEGQDVGKVSNTKLKNTPENEKWLQDGIKQKCLIAVVEYLPMDTGKLRFPVLKEIRIL